MVLCPLEGKINPLNVVLLWNPDNARSVKLKALMEELSTSMVTRTLLECDISDGLPPSVFAACQSGLDMTPPVILLPEPQKHLVATDLANVETVSDLRVLVDTEVAGIDILPMVSQAYAKTAQGSGLFSGQNVSCCGGSGRDYNIISKMVGYSEEDLKENGNLGLGCGNPRSFANFKEGETILDLGSGAGFDSFLAAKAVGPSGMVIGVDMTHEMLQKARNAEKTNGIKNVDFRLGEIENLPVADAIVDCVISNCVINLSYNKKRVFEEAFRVLKTPFLFRKSSFSQHRPDTRPLLPHPFRLQQQKNCAAAGFAGIKIRKKDQSAEYIRDWLPESKAEDFIVSAEVTAWKPLSA
eukprot:GEMP01040727.1.p1 GENE.GEMP01040727.1~~GEMP01040727.1.p1  ORF type:complete len:362 (+),score=80.49 GEMP01040727.1:27-1088(+)